MRDFAPVAMVSNSPFMLTAYSHLPIWTLKNWSRSQNRGRACCGMSARTVTLPYVAGVLFERLTEIEIINVRYRAVTRPWSI